MISTLPLLQMCAVCWATWSVLGHTSDITINTNVWRMLGHTSDITINTNVWKVLGHTSDIIITITTDV